VEYRKAIHFKMSVIGTIETGEDVRERCLAGTILTEERVNLADSNIKIDVLVGNDAREPLRHAKGGHRNRGGRPGTSITSHRTG
jgi:hypothetical protein